MTQRSGQLHLNAFLLDVGHHEAAWRLPESDPFASGDVEHYKNLARIAERGKLDSLSLADVPALWGTSSNVRTQCLKSRALKLGRQPVLPSGLEAFVDEVVPIFAEEKRRLFQRDYQGKIAA